MAKKESKYVYILDDNDNIIRKLRKTHIETKDEKLIKATNLEMAKLTKKNVIRLMNRQCIYNYPSGTRCRKKTNSVISPYCPEHTPKWLGNFLQKKDSKKALERRKRWEKYDKTHPFVDDTF